MREYNQEITEEDEQRKLEQHNKGGKRLLKAKRRHAITPYIRTPVEKLPKRGKKQKKSQGVEVHEIEEEKLGIEEVQETGQKEAKEGNCSGCYKKDQEQLTKEIEETEQERALKVYEETRVLYDRVV